MKSLSVLNFLEIFFKPRFSESSFVFPKLTLNTFVDVVYRVISGDAYEGCLKSS